jgi:glycosyltransferase involved in cell wall biosynthesis
MRIGFISTRFEGTDGVTLEAAKWARVLESDGHECFWFAGKLDLPEESSFLFEEAFFGQAHILALHENLFGCRKRSRDTTDEIHDIKHRCKDALYEFIEKFQLDLIIPQNILAIPIHVPLGLAITELMAETRIPTIAHHHDFYWERDRFSHTSVPEYLEMAFPPVIPGQYANVVINSAGRSDLSRRRGLDSTLIPNVFDFENEPVPDPHGADLREEIGVAEDEVFVLQPTRVVNRKGIEHAIDLVRLMQKSKPDRKIALVISHDAGDEGYDYYENLVERAEEASVRLLFIGDRVSETREPGADGRKRYSLWDIYPHADLVTYPSLYEGFGNAFLEAIWFRKPVFINRYSIYIRDIEPHGFKVIDINGVVTKKSVAATWTIIEDEEKASVWAEHNYQLGLKHYSHGVLQKHLRAILSHLFPE